MNTMKSIYLLAFLLCTSLGFAQTPASDAYASTIESEDLKQLLYVYASDFFYISLLCFISTKKQLF